MQSPTTLSNRSNKIIKFLANLATISLISYIEFFIIAAAFTRSGVLDYDAYNTVPILITTEIILLSLSLALIILRSYMSYKQLHKNRPSKLPVIWSLFGRIIPIVNFIVPFNILRTLSKGSDQTDNNIKGPSITITILQTLLMICAIFFIINTTPIELPMIPRLIYRLLIVISCGLFIYIIRKISTSLLGKSLYDRINNNTH